MGGGSLCLLNAPQFSKYFFPNVICVFTWKTIFLCIFKYFTFSRHTFELTSWSEVCFVFKYFSHKYLKVVSEWTPVQKYLHRVFWPSREHRTRLRFCSRWLQSELDLDERESFLLLWLEIRFINQYPVFFFFFLSCGLVIRDLVLLSEGHGFKSCPDVVWCVWFPHSLSRDWTQPWTNVDVCVITRTQTLKCDLDTDVNPALKILYLFTHFVEDHLDNLAAEMGQNQISLKNWQKKRQIINLTSGVPRLFF